MIKNSRQAATARKRRDELLHAAERADPGKESAYLELVTELARELSEYEAIRNGQINEFEIDGFDNLGDALIKARLARGWSHRQLAQVLGVSEQMIQKDESRSYERAGLARMAEIADGLGYHLMGSLSPIYLPTPEWRRASNQITTGTSTLAPSGPWNTFVPTMSVTVFTGAIARVAVPISAGWLPWLNDSAYVPTFAGSTAILTNRLPPMLAMPYPGQGANYSSAMVVEEAGNVS
jgi:ribosome-binding protein aMBF1 (putative translation factor)